MKDYNCEEMVKKGQENIKELEGKILRNFLYQFVSPEFNIAYLIFDDSIFAIHGALGSEVIQIRIMDEVISQYEDENIGIREFLPFSIFLGRKIVQVRTIGMAWNGHGFEFSFEGLFDRTMIIQSIYAGDIPKEFNDCIRLGIGQYFFNCNELIDE